MKKINLLLIFIGISVSLSAQNVSYEKLEEFSKKISSFQSTANGLKYTDGRNSYEISFSETNFLVTFHNQLATNSVYKKQGDIETLELTENIDLSKVLTITIISYENNVVRLQLEFPAGSIITQRFANGEQLDTKSGNMLEMYAGKDYWDLYTDLVTLAHYLKKEKKKFTGNVEEVTADWKKAFRENSSKGYQNFINKNANTLFESEANKKIRAFEKIKLEEERKQQAIKAENERIRLAEEARRLKEAQEERERIAEELRQKELRNVGFGAFRVGYVMPTNEISKSNDIVPDYLSNGNPYFFGSEYQPFTSPFTSGKMGLKSGFSAGFTGIIHLEFINKKLPKFMGLGIPLDANLAMMRYSWKPMADGAGDESFLYTNAKYSMWGVVSLGAGLSLSFRPVDHLFIDLVARPEFFLTLGGNYSSDGTRGSMDYSISSDRNDNGIGFAYAYGVNVRYKHLFLNFEYKGNVIDKRYFIEYVKVTNSGSTVVNNKYNVYTPGINLSFMQVSLGVVF